MSLIKRKKLHVREIIGNIENNSFLVATIGGLLGELWLVLDVLQAEHQTELTLEEVIFAEIFNID